MSPSFNASPLWISLATTCAATAATFVLGLVAARALYRKKGGWAAWIDGLLTLPLVLPPTVVGYFLLLLFGRRSPLGQLLEHVGVTIVFSWPATVLAATVVAFPLMYRTTRGAFEQVSPKLLDAARTLGATEGRIFRRVLMPLAAPGLLAGTVLSFARALGEFGATLMVAGNIPGRTQTMPLAIFTAAAGGEMQAALVWVTLIVLLSLGIVRLLNWRFVAGGGELASVAVEAGGIPSLEGAPGAGGGVLEMEVRKRLRACELRIGLNTRAGTLGLLGGSGAGKSMALRMIAGIERPESGRIVLNGRILFDSVSGKNLPAAQRRVGMVFQDYALFPHMTVAENVGFGLSGLGRAEREERVRRQLAGMGIGELAARYPGEISGGERQRVAIARALAIEPEALLFDEPFAALDTHLRRRMEEQLRWALREYRGAVVFVTHAMEEAFRFCTELVVLERGRVIASGPKQRIFEQPLTLAAARLTGCKNMAGARRVGERRIAVDAWRCELETAEPVPERLAYAGVRSHQIGFSPAADATNSFPCWVMATSEGPHEMTVYLRLHQAPRTGDAPHLEADVAKERWEALREAPQPWRVQLKPERVLLLEGPEG